MALTDKLKAIADAIRTKTGGTASLTMDEMATAISDIQSGGATEPYIEETYGADDLLTAVKYIGHKFIRGYSLYSQTRVTKIEFSSTVEKIKSYAIGCPNLTEIVLPISLKTIEYMAFKDSGKLNTITFKSKPNSINGSAFSGLTNLTTINVPWAEGEVAYAPWGATNATINYNYTGE